MATMPATPKILPKSVAPAIADKTMLLLEIVPSCLLTDFLPLTNIIIANGNFLKFTNPVIKAKYIDANNNHKIKKGSCALSVQNKTSKNKTLSPKLDIAWKMTSEFIFSFQQSKLTSQYIKSQTTYIAVHHIQCQCVFAYMPFMCLSNERFTSKIDDIIKFIFASG